MIVSSKIRFVMLLMLVMLLAACNRSQGGDINAIPTRITSLDDLATSQVLTENAPPPGFRETIAFPQVDANLLDLSNWRYEVFVNFNGVFSGTSREAQASITQRTWYNQLNNARRVVLEASGILLGAETGEPLAREGVRLGENTFGVVDNVCQGVSAEAEVIAELRAGDIIGGVAQAQSTSQQAIIHGEQVWRYTFTADDLNLPLVRFSESSRITSVTGEFWVSPERNAVIRFWLNMDVENVVITFLSDNPDAALPVSGQIVVRYDLYDIGTDPNITQPFGC